eukprot:3938133-Pyramimonas_sp.AAC.1
MGLHCITNVRLLVITPVRMCTKDGWQGRKTRGGRSRDLLGGGRPVKTAKDGPQRQGHKGTLDEGARPY